MRALLVHLASLLQGHKSYGPLLTPFVLLTSFDPKVLQKFLLSVFAIRRGQQLVAALRPAGCCALLPCLHVSIDALVQALDSYYESYRRVIGQRQHGKYDTLKWAADQRHADSHDLVSQSFLHLPEPFRTSSADLV